MKKAGYFFGKGPVLLTNCFYGFLMFFDSFYMKILLSQIKHSYKKTCLKYVHHFATFATFTGRKRMSRGHFQLFCACVGIIFRSVPVVSAKIILKSGKNM